MAIPGFDPNSGPPLTLPPGEHEASLDEIREFFGFSYRRRELFEDLERIVVQLFEQGALKIWLDGSYVTGIKNPQDTDVVFLSPEGADFSPWLIAQRHLKRRFRVHLWDYPSYQAKPGVWPAGQRRPITEYFKSTEDGTEKGIIVVRRP
jgi:hypothetical protein